MAYRTPLLARVKSVPSGDTLVICSTKNPEEEKIFSLAFVNAPRMRREGDEPYAFESRDFLRQKVVGKVIQFRALYTVPSTDRQYGTIYLQNGETYPTGTLEAGWAKIRDDADRKDSSHESLTLLDDLKERESIAKRESKGVWAPGSGASKIQVLYQIPDPKSFVEKHKGKLIPSIVERVLSGDRMLIRFILSPTQHVQTLVVVAGIRAPSSARTNPTDGKVQPAEPFGAEAHQFVEFRMLHRDVQVDVLGLTPQNVLVCSVIHPNGSIAEFILRAGLAQCTDTHSTLLGGKMSALRSAEREAKDARLGLFKGHVDQVISTGDTDATVSRVHNADTIYIRDKAGEERRVSISSIRQPKPKDPQQAPFQVDAKEFLRKKMIGKHIKVTVDGRKPASEGFEEQDAVTVLLNNKNVGLQLVEAGYASVVRHGKNATDRSPIWDDLVAAETTAQAEAKGMWSTKPPSVKTYQDYSETLQKAKVQASVLQRQKRIPGMVDYVKGGSRFTVLIPRENAKLTLVLSGIRCPRSARSPNEKSEPFGQEAHDFANRRCLQRDVEIDIETTDKIGGFIGSLYVNRENFAKLLLEEGLATVHAYSAEQSGSATELFAAEEKAKTAKRGLWHDYDPSQDEVADISSLSVADPPTSTATNGNTAPTSAPQKKDYRDVQVTHIDPTNLHLKLHLISPSHSHALTSLMSAFKAYHASPSALKTLPQLPPKTGDLVSARYSADNEWYRAKVRRNDREAKKSDVLFVDYGNSETVAWTELRPLGDPSKFGFAKLRAQSIDAGLTFCQFSTSAEYIADAVALLTDLTVDKQLVASVEHEEKDAAGNWWITLFDPNNGAGSEEESLNAEVVAEGLAVVARKLRPWELGRPKVQQYLKQKEEEAREGKRGMWEYGDISED